MSCDLDGLSRVDTGDPGQLDAMLQECTAMLLSPELWYWAIGFTVVGAVVGALIGKYKNAVVRDALLGAALGPIGWIISALLPRTKPAPLCPSCGKVVGTADAHCKFCGTKLTAAV